MKPQPSKYSQRPDPLLRLILAALFSIFFQCIAVTPVQAAPEADPITGNGQACAVSPDGNTYCYDLTITFTVSGGSVDAYGSGVMPVSQNGTTYEVHADFVFTGTFEGGDGGAVSGSWTGTSSMALPGGETAGASSGGTWEGNLYASGEGHGTFQGSMMSQDGWWDVYYDAAEFMAGLPTSTPTISPPTATVTQAPPTVSAAEENTQEVQPAAAAILTEGPPDRTVEQQDAVPPTVPDVQQAAADPLAPLSGAAAGTVLGGLLAWLASKAGRGSVEVEQAVEEYLAREGSGSEPGRGGQFDQEVAAKWSEMLRGISRGNEGLVSDGWQGMEGSMQTPASSSTAGFGTDVNILPSAGENTDTFMRAINIYDALLQTKGTPDPRLKYLGPLSAVKGFWDRWTVLADRRKDESLFYRFSTMLEAGTLETVKFFATKNPYIGILDNAAGQIFGTNPSDAICDKTSSMLEGELMDDIITNQVYRGGQYGERHYKDMQNFTLEEARNEVKVLKGRLESGEISEAEYKEKVKSAVRPWRLDYYERSAEQIEGQNRYWSSSWLK